MSVEMKLTVDDDTDARHQQDTEYPQTYSQHTEVRVCSCFTICLWWESSYSNHDCNYNQIIHYWRYDGCMANVLSFCIVIHCVLRFLFSLGLDGWNEPLNRGFRVNMVYIAYLNHQTFKLDVVKRLQAGQKDQI